jgi:hypothetical protein
MHPPNPRRFWNILTFAQPGCALGLGSLLSEPVRIATWCQVGLAHIDYSVVIAVAMSFGVLYLAIAATFATHAIRNTAMSLATRVAWAIVLVLFAPVAGPAYRALHIR